MKDLIKTFQDLGFEYDILGIGWGKRLDKGEFVRVKPFWIGLKEVIENYSKKRKDTNDN